MISIDNLTLEEKIGQMLCLGWQSEGDFADGDDDAYLSLNDQARRCVGELHAGGMILFARNVQASGSPKPPVDVARVRGMIAELQSLAKIPLFVAVDQEGGASPGSVPRSQRFRVRESLAKRAVPKPPNMLPTVSGVSCVRSESISTSRRLPTLTRIRQTR
ncbi:MAG: hypothetical protein H8F28_26455 [Fibrella sp.]|nr:hypothetical protein [Armatimonadota bacterium]